jgi:glycosyltransferase involved in cell wall biosynthesis
MFERSASPSDDFRLEVKPPGRTGASPGGTRTVVPRRNPDGGIRAVSERWREGVAMPDGTPSCSVVIPVLNDAVVLERCLLALARQELVPLEVIVVDNGSTDGSFGVAERSGATVVREPRPGIAAAAARGYDAATGELILRLDADSTPPRDWTARVARAFAADGGLDALTGPGEFTAVPSPVRRLLTSWYWRIYFEGIGRQAGTRPLFGSNLAMRATAWRDVSASVHRADLMVHDDLDLSIHLERAGRRIVVDPRLRMPVSARPLVHPVGMVRRARRASHTLALHAAPRASSPRRRWAGRSATTR